MVRKKSENIFERHQNATLLLLPVTKEVNLPQLKSHPERSTWKFPYPTHSKHHGPELQSTLAPLLRTAENFKSYYPHRCLLQNFRKYARTE
ncbi:hypothetical protein TNCV_460871 [Trichonephila clavipes]|nr:hypothetical protein TNCV_460871 [Trichonephila clavipes]